MFEIAKLQLKVLTPLSEKMRQEIRKQQQPSNSLMNMLHLNIWICYIHIHGYTTSKYMDMQQQQKICHSCNYTEY